MKKLSIVTGAALLAASGTVLAYEDITPTAAYDWVNSPDANVVILDVRTREEWGFVGHPAPNDADGDTPGTGLAGKVHNVSLKVEDKGLLVDNKWFLDDVKKLFADNPNVTIITMCRSGKRSVAAAKVLEAAGFNVFNMVGGFEGGRDTLGYRGKANSGWKNSGLPYLADCDGRGYVPRSVTHDSLNK